MLHCNGVDLYTVIYYTDSLAAHSHTVRKIDLSQSARRSLGVASPIVRSDDVSCLKVRKRPRMAVSANKSRRLRTSWEAEANGVLGVCTLH